MYHGPKIQFFRFVTNSIELVLRKRGLAALTDAARRKDLDDISAILGALLDHAAQLFGRAVGVPFAGDGLKRSEDPRARQSETVNGIAEVFIKRRAEALYGGETGSEHLPIVRGACEDGLLLRLVLASELARGVEMPSRVDVRINPAGQDRQPGEVVSDRTFWSGFTNARNLSALDYDNCVVQCLPSAIKEGGSPQNDRPLLGGYKSRGEAQRE